MPNGCCGCCRGNNSYSVCCYSSPKCKTQMCCSPRQYCCPTTCCVPMQTCCYVMRNNRRCCDRGRSCCGH